MLITFLVGLNSSVLHCLQLPESQDLSTFHLHLLYETQSPQNVCKFLGNKTVSYSAAASTSLDLHALSYCLCSSDCYWCLYIDLRNFSSFFSTVDKSYKGHIRILEIWGASVHNLQLFFSLPKRIFSDLHRLEIIRCEPVASIVGDILGRIIGLKQFCFVSNTLSGNLSSVMESLFGYHSKLVHCW